MINPTIDAGILPPAFAVGDHVFYDVNRNGVQDQGEPPAAGVTVTLYTQYGRAAVDASGRAVPPVETDAAGHYVFDGLGAGAYYVTFTGLPSGYRLTTQSSPAGSSATDSNPDPTGRTPVFTLNSDATDMRAIVDADGTTLAYQINPTIDAGLIADAGITPPPLIPPPAAPPLAYTGVPVVHELGIALLLVLLGAAALVIGRRGRRPL